MTQSQFESSRVTPWTDVAVESLKKFWAEGLTATQIACRIPSVTRNAVIGKAHRIGLAERAPRKPSDAAKALRIRRARAPQVRRVAAKPSILEHHGFDRTLKVGPVAEPMPMPIPAADDVARVSFADLENHHCRFPIGDPREPGFGYCGADKHEGLPYCTGHSQRAFTPPATKPRAPAEPRKPAYTRVPLKELV